MKIIALTLLLALSVFAQTQTTGRIAGTLRDQQDALIIGGNITVTNQATGEERTATTDEAGNFAVAFLSPGIYRIRFEAKGFNVFNSENVSVSITETTTINATLGVARAIAEQVVIENDKPLIKTDSATLGQVFDGQTAAELPLATRNLTQLFALVPGASAFLTDNTVVGRNTQNVSVNGGRLGQNNFQINGIDANFGFATSTPVANPALESIAEFKLQTSLYDASFGRAGGGSVQVITRSGANKLSGAIYDYFGNTRLNANNPFLKAAGLPRPVLERNIFGFALGSAIKRDRAFFFASFQTMRERNGASRLNSISSGVLVGTTDVPLTDDRSAATLSSRFGVPQAQIHSISLELLKARLPNGDFLIPTPQTGSRYNGSAISRFREEQFNLNFDFRLTPKNWLNAKIFFARARQTLALLGNVNVPGFPTRQSMDSLLVSIQDVQSFNSNLTNEARIGFNLSVLDFAPQTPFLDSDFHITRTNAAAYPGFPIINIAGAAGGVQFGTIALNYLQNTILTPTFADTLSFTHRAHSIRLGLELRAYLFNINLPVQTRGNITFADFRDFLRGIPSQTRLASGITDRAFRTTDYNFFVQDDWWVSEKLTLNLGLRYELDLPAYETRGRISAFDPTLYRPPSMSGIALAGNAPHYDNLSGVEYVGKRVLNSLDANNFAPRVGLAYTPFDKKSFVVRAGYGIYYSRSALSYLVNNILQPPFYFNVIVNNSTARAANFSSPFAPNIPTQFPTLGGLLAGNSIDRNIRTPYFQQFNAAAQFWVFKNTTLEIAYVGSRGLNLFRLVAINQATLTPTNNLPGNAQARAPFQVAAVGGAFLQDQSTAESVYNSMQLNLTRRLSGGLQFQAAYTLSKSIDNASGGGGAGTNGLTDTQSDNDTAPIVGNQLDNRANRGLSNFDRRHRFTASFIWQLPPPAFTNRSKIGRVLFSGWQIAGIITATSGLPIDVVDSLAATFYLGVNGGGARPNYVAGISPTANIPNGYYFNPFAFARPVVLSGQPIPSSNGAARAGANGTDFGNVGRNILRGPNQFNTDFSISKRFRLGEAKNIEFRTDFFNLFNNVNFANPISNLAAVPNNLIDANTGRINRDSVVELGFGQIISTSNNQRLVQFAIKFNF
jgi:hypothetical protein